MADTIYIYDPVETALTKNFGAHIRQRVRDARYVARVQDVGPGVVNAIIPLLVICYNHSRIGTDIDSSLSALKGYSKRNVAILVIHSMEVHALPICMPTDTLTDVRYDELGKLIDFAVSPANFSLYHCNMNDTGYIKLDEFLDLHCRRRDFSDNRRVIDRYMYTVFGRRFNLEQILFTVFLACVFVVFLTLVVVLIKN